MISFFKKNKNHPDFWKDYERKFQHKLPELIQDVRFVVLDTETTGFDLKKDRILCIGAVNLEHNNIEISRTLELYIDQETFNPDTVKIHGIIKNEDLNTLTEREALVTFLNYIENAVLVAHHAQFDIAMINHALKRLGLPKLKNKVLDTMVLYRATRINSNLIDQNKHYSLDEVAENLNISVKDRHTAAGDAMITAIAFLKIVAKLNKKDKGKLKHLLQVN
ncbi:MULTISPECIES: 3'-5' exonuclease [Galbibacter]|uniref:3'-5' exonuclease n=1 Tax=Galbibacter pacificus TaxID=2996052 RepID=A0ABT6FPD0_9FLAO|nr:3'-5' exonuclease [Galbibacter pacificus]MDG3581645.1 3'-5' exonuclease [Galbibacter pacificus]MDG3585123.1 3'-5' exonuclease [Galbibacter pacificus]